MLTITNEEKNVMRTYIKNLGSVVALAAFVLFCYGCVPPGVVDPEFTYYEDLDDDGYGNPLESITLFDPVTPPYYAVNNLDCDDTDEFVNPGVEEVANDGIDNDCDGVVDEGFYTIGDTGPAGGIVFYVDSMYEHGLEAAPADIDVAGDFHHEWGCYDIAIAGADGTAIGTGAQNTVDMLAAGCTSYYDNDLASDLVDAYSLNGFTDWFLPSKDELNVLYAQRAVVGGFASDYYWSSFEYSANVAWRKSFLDGYPSNYFKYVALRVRAVRAF